jgi:hypothetical protein
MSTIIFVRRLEILDKEFQRVQHTENVKQVQPVLSIEHVDRRHYGHSFPVICMGISFYTSVGDPS